MRLKSVFVSDRQSREIERLRYAAQTVQVLLANVAKDLASLKRVQPPPSFRAKPFVPPSSVPAH